MNKNSEATNSTQLIRLLRVLRTPTRGFAVAILSLSLLAGCTQDEAPDPASPDDPISEDADALDNLDSENEMAPSESGEATGDTEAAETEGEDVSGDTEGAGESEDTEGDEAPPVVGAVITLEAGEGGDPQGEEGEEGKPGPNEVVPIEAEPHVLLGQAAPDFSMVDAMTDEPVTLADFEGQTVLVNFWATWCVPCRQEMPWIQSTYEKYQDQGFAVLAVDTAEQIPPEQIPGRVKQYAERTGLTFPMLIDEGNAVGGDYGVTSALPISFFVDADGQVSHHHQGMYPNEVSLEQLVREQMGLAEAE